MRTVTRWVLRTALAASVLTGGLSTFSLLFAGALPEGTAAAGVESAAIPGGTSGATVGAGDPLTITSLSRASGPVTGGNTVTITGSGFSTVQRVKFGTTTARSFTNRSVTQLVAVTPPHAAGTVRISVTIPGGMTPTTSSDLYQFTVSAPVVSSVSPASGPAGGGSTVTVNGSGFTGATAVSFGLSKGTTFSVNLSGTQLTVKSPLGTLGASVNVEVETPGGESPAVPGDLFTYGPTITSLSRTSGPTAGGTKVTITGDGFATVTNVRFGTTPATALTVKSTSQVVATSPAGNAGTVDITVSEGTITSAVAAADLFSYVGSSPPNSPVSVTVAAGQPETTTINQGLIGFNHVPAGSTPALAAIGTKWARTDVSFETTVNGQPVYNCATGAWNPQVLDANVANDRQAGATPELIVDYTRRAWPPTLRPESTPTTRRPTSGRTWPSGRPSCIRWHSTRSAPRARGLRGVERAQRDVLGGPGQGPAYLTLTRPRPPRSRRQPMRSVCTFSSAAPPWRACPRCPTWVGSTSCARWP